MGMGAGILLMAIGAILAWAVDLNLEVVETTTLGWILIVVGAIGAIAAALIGRRSATVVEERRRL